MKAMVSAPGRNQMIIPCFRRQKGHRNTAPPGRLDLLRMQADECILRMSDAGNDISSGMSTHSYTTHQNFVAFITKRQNVEQRERDRDTYDIGQTSIAIPLSLHISSSFGCLTKENLQAARSVFDTDCPNCTYPCPIRLVPKRIAS